MRPASVLLLLLLASVASAQQPSVDDSILWAHGEVRDEGEVLWANFQDADPKATDTANGPGYNCPVGVDPVGVGLTLCGMERESGPGLTKADGDETFTLAMDPALASDFFLDVTGTVTFNVFLGSSSGAGSGTYDAMLINGETTVAEVTGVPFEYSSGYTAAIGEATPLVDTVSAEGGLTWEIHVTGNWNGMFLGVHGDTGKTSVELPIIAGLLMDEDPAAGPADNETVEQNATDDDALAETEDPEPSETQSPAPEPTTAEEPAADVSESAPVDTAGPKEESSGIPAPGLVPFLAVLGAALWVARRRL